MSISVHKLIVNRRLDEGRLDLLSITFGALHLKECLQLVVNVEFVFLLVLRFGVRSLLLLVLALILAVYLLREVLLGIGCIVEMRLLLLVLLWISRLLSLHTVEVRIEHVWLLLVRHVGINIILRLERGLRGLLLELVNRHLGRLRSLVLQALVGLLHNWL